MLDLAAHRPSRQAIDDNPIWRLLRDAGIDWCASRAALLARHGRSYDSTYRESVTAIPSTHPAFSGMLKPLSVFQAPGASPALPPTMFTGIYFDTGVEPQPQAGVLERLLGRSADPVAFHDAMVQECFDRTVARFASVLGRGDESGVSNTIGRRWRSGPASIELVAWPRERNTDLGRNVYHEREPRLAYATHVTVTPGFVLQATASELHLLDGAVPMLAPPVATVAWRAEESAGNATVLQQEFVRRIPRSATHAQRAACTAAIGGVWLSEAREALLLPSVERLGVIPLSQIETVQVERCLPARGGGYATLAVRCRTDFGRGDTHSFVLWSAPAADDLTDCGAAFARLLQRPCVVGAYFHDD